MAFVEVQKPRRALNSRAGTQTRPRNELIESGSMIVHKSGQRQLVVGTWAARLLKEGGICAF